jgi:four helix bundle protein
MAPEIRSFRDLIAWQKAMELCEQVYTLSQAFPAEERFGLTAQLRRAAVSVPSNIAEGYGRGQTRDYLRFLKVARGSLFEVQTQLLLAVRLKLASADSAGRCLDLAGDVDRIICALIRAVRDSATKVDSA